jgi:flagellar basal body-associated protein FliL
VKKKLIIVLPIVLLAAVGGVYKFVLAPKPAPPPPPKIEGAIVKLPQEFVLNLAEGHYGRVTVALVVPHTALPAAAHGGGTDSSGLEQEAAIRAIVTDELTGVERGELVQRKARHHVLEKLAKRLHKETDTEVEDVLFTDIAVQ